jgi:hypothetical protein
MRLVLARLVTLAIGSATLAGPVFLPMASAHVLSAAVHVSTPTSDRTSETWSVTLDKTTVASKLGNRFRFTSTIRNESRKPSPGTIAYLNIVSMDPSVYVDPEDWSSQRTRYLGAVAPRGTVPVDWTVQAVNSGRFVVFVAVTSERGSVRVVSSNALRVDIANQRSLNPSGILPVVVAVPGLAAVALVVTTRRRRKLR